jgi:hypothetical protein
VVPRPRPSLEFPPDSYPHFTWWAKALKEHDVFKA